LPKVKALVAEIDQVEQAYGPVALAIVRLALEGQHDAAIAKMNSECRPLLASLISRPMPTPTPRRNAPRR
jgi:methyl-accepting chemotaxis protein-1 (serine sensor receptor)